MAQGTHMLHNPTPTIPIKVLMIYEELNEPGNTSGAAHDTVREQKNEDCERRQGRCNGAVESALTVSLKHC
jgi:hypothetical protein